MRYPRFNIRTLLGFVTLFAILLAVYPYARRYIAWYDVRKGLDVWAQQLERKPGKIESYVHMNLTFNNDPQKPPSSTQFAVMTAEPERGLDANGTETWTTSANSIPDSKRFFVIPPGKWVDDIDSVINTWDSFRSGVYRQ